MLDQLCLVLRGKFVHNVLLILIKKEIVFTDKTFVSSFRLLVGLDLHLLLGEAMDPEPLNNAV